MGRAAERLEAEQDQGNNDAASEQVPHYLFLILAVLFLRCHVTLSDSALLLFPEFRHFCMAVAIHHVVIDHANGLHESITDGRPAESEALGLKGL